MRAGIPAEALLSSVKTHLSRPESLCVVLLITLLRQDFLKDFFQNEAFISLGSFSFIFTSIGFPKSISSDMCFAECFSHALLLPPMFHFTVNLHEVIVKIGPVTVFVLDLD